MSKNVKSSLKSLKDLGVMVNVPERTEEVGENHIVFFINPAPYIEDAEEAPDKYAETSHRGNTPWVVVVPTFDRVWPLYNAEGEPLCGYLKLEPAVRSVKELLSKIKAGELEAPASAPPLQVAPGNRVLVANITI